MRMSALVERLKGLGNLAVLAGIILIAVEIRQASRLVEAQLASDEAALWVEIDNSRQGENLADALAKAIEHPEDLTLAEMLEVDGYLYTFVGQLWRRGQLYELGIGDSMETVVGSWVPEYFGNEFARAWWAESKFKFGDAFVEIVERGIQDISATQDLEFFGRIKSRLASEPPAEETPADSP